jgi:PX domain
MEFSKRVKSKKQRPMTPFGQEENLLIYVREPQVNPGGIFTSSYVSYKIITMPFEFVVFRRYSDFRWLYLALKKEFPGYFVVPLHAKQNKRNLEMNYLTKRMIFLERFLNGLTRSKELRNSAAFALFLSSTSEAEFSKKKAALTKETTCTTGMGEGFSRRQFVNASAKPKIEEIENSNGEVFLALSNHERAFYENWNEYLTGLEPLYKK